MDRPLCHPDFKMVPPTESIVSQEARENERSFYKALGLWALTNGIPAIAVWFFFLRFDEDWTELYFAGLLATAMVLIPVLMRGLRQG